jgi:hypothetical protein
MNSNVSVMDRTASFISAIFSPYLVAIVTVSLVAYAPTKNVAAAARWSLLTLIVFIAPTFLYVWVQVRQGGITDLHIRDRAQRHSIYLIVLVSEVALVALMSLLDAPAAIIALILSVLLANGTYALINRRWKISLHAAGMGGTTVALSILYGSLLAATTVLLSAAVLWSRIRTSSHTAAQTAVGYVLAAAITYLVFRVMGLS